VNHQQAATDTLQQAMQRHRAGDQNEAELLYAATLRLEPDNVQALRLRGALARERGDIGASRSFLQHAAQQAPDDAEVLSEIALTCMAAGDLPGAAHNLHKCLLLDPGSARAAANLGAVLQQRGHINAAINSYKKSLSAEEDIFVRCNLAKALSDTGNFAAALDVCDDTNDTNQPQLLATRGVILLDQQCFADARDILLKATLLVADDMALVNLALAQHQTGDVMAAVNTLRQASELNPANARAVADLANCLCAMGDYAAAITTCETFLQHYPGERLVLGSYALALHNAGRDSAALALTNCDSLVRVFDCPPPKGIVNVQTMNAMLNDELRADSSRLLNPISKSTTGGEQTGELELERSLALKALQEFIQTSISTTANAFIDQGLSEHPVMTPAQGNQSIRAWGTLLSQGGRQTSHMHPLGWLSGVYYSHLPADMNNSDPEAGWLEFNAPPERFHQHKPAQTWRYQPAEGRMILFPSWFWHQTLPFESTDERISIAFDIVPTAALRML
jgi:uncharacterized protein (TIGR02466 family)